MKKQAEINKELKQLQEAIIEYGNIRDNIRELKEYIAYNVDYEKDEYYDVCNLAERQAYNDVMDTFCEIMGGIGINEMQNSFILNSWIKNHDDKIFEVKRDDGWIELRWRDDDSVMFILEDFNKKKD